jgi:hypothetical protein
MTMLQQITTVILITGLLGCNQQPNTDSTLRAKQVDSAGQSKDSSTTNQADKPLKSDAASTTQKTENSKYYATTDTLIITMGNFGTVKYGKDEFNSIVDNHLELFTDYWEDPDKKYYCNSKEFGSEIGQDDYYVLYAYLLRQKNGVDKYAEQRKKLIDIYSNINSLFQKFQYGGTYFGHQYSRILGYAEYSVYLHSEHNRNFEKTYDITKQKEFYIKSLRQLIDDESEIDGETLEKDKAERNKELNEIVDNLNKLITDTFYLRRTQEFHYGHYAYY